MVAARAALGVALDQNVSIVGSGRYCSDRATRPLSMRPVGEGIGCMCISFLVLDDWLVTIAPVRPSARRGRAFGCTTSACAPARAWRR